MIRRNQNDVNRYGFLARQQYRALRDAFMQDAREAVNHWEREQFVRKARWLNGLVVANLRG